MQLTDYHAKYIAHQLTRRCPPDSVEKLAAALVDAQVDLNPHQIDAALRSGFSRTLFPIPLAGSSSDSTRYPAALAKRISTASTIRWPKRW